jgi:hypothetical protein
MENLILWQEKKKAKEEEEIAKKTPFRTHF